ncbi:hypothetical protein [Streptomyces sp. NPDC054787]
MKLALIAVARTRALGLFPEPLTASPYAAEFDAAEVTEPADEDFWTRVRPGLGPRALLTVWPNLTPDVGAVLATLPEEGSVEFVWEAQDGMISHAIVDDTEYEEFTALVADARAACALPLYLDERHPLLRAALPDSDGVLRARW